MVLTELVLLQVMQSCSSMLQVLHSPQAEAADCLARLSAGLIHTEATTHRWTAVGDQLQVVHLPTTGFWSGYLMHLNVHTFRLCNGPQNGEHVCLW